MSTRAVTISTRLRWYAATEGEWEPRFHPAGPPPNALSGMQPGLNAGRWEWAAGPEGEARPGRSGHPRRPMVRWLHRCCDVGRFVPSRMPALRLHDHGRARPWGQEPGSRTGSATSLVRHHVTSWCSRGPAAPESRPAANDRKGRMGSCGPAASIEDDALPQVKGQVPELDGRTPRKPTVRRTREPASPPPENRA